ncbi:uncharacterized protein LOC117578850 [Drosophila guanche]|uniref:Uncharacterized protein n=1 Tax=Drosophila guanche TaxID=7266 RepID=A0A3B0JPH8_DROGU|nr:uncharacterized protein LOC117578850 [Drosophila guanche]SPP75246.1 Hypothetical predicted protein [Drosophila guanche]
MFFSLAQTLFCVLLIQGGLYALHLSGNGEKSSPSSSVMMGPVDGGAGQAIGPDTSSSSYLTWKPAPSQQQQHHQQHPGGAPPGGGHASHRSAAAAAYDATTVRLNKEIADMAQLERERLMLLARAGKQTAESNGPTGHGARGHQFIAGRIQMQPSEELDVGDYPALLQQAARGFIFGSVQKEPPAPLSNEEDYEQLGELDSHPVKYYGRVVEPADREQEIEPPLYEPLHSFGDFDDFSELDQEPHLGEDELLRELDTYQYHGMEEEPLPENPYRTLEQLELGAPESMQQLFEQDHRDGRPAKLAGHPGSTHPGTGNFNIRMQQKWARKRAGAAMDRQLPSLQRNIFGQHFKQQRGLLSLANSEATASKHLKASTRSGSLNLNAPKDIEKSAQTDASGGGSAAGAASQQQNKPQHESTSGDAQPQQQQQKQQQQQPQKSNTEDKKEQSEQQLLHPNHKRSGSVKSGGVGAQGGGYAPAPSVSHSVASQLMLRTARGQRQYDVPQIECPTAMDGMERFACPVPDRQGRYRCIDDHVLCDGFIDCPDGEDEDRRSCMFYKTTKAHLDVLADALLRWARGR